MIYGIGTDIVDIKKFKKALDRRGARFLKKLFTEEELIYCLKQKFPGRHLAVRFAAKESVFKALGSRVPFRSIEIGRDLNGSPFVKVIGFKEGFRFHLSLSHDGGYGVATVVLEKIS